METHPADQPNPLVAKLTRPTPAYKRRAWLATGGLALFVLLYFALAGQFLHTAWRLTLGGEAGSANAFWGWGVGACAAFLAVFMLKAVFFVRHGGAGDSIEITPAHQPELFRFLHRLADKAGAPRPHKVFVSARVNAAVFYDLSILNLFFPSKKNLEIGLGLVNSLTLGEFRAVLAHEFGHFAQRAMAVGRWVYVGQQIAAQLVARRDKLDDFLRALSRFDVRVAWVGWLLSLVVWSIRSLVESAFQLVVLMQRALSREMEMNADLVAVSVTGSDALIHALHRLQAADDAWGRAVNFVMSQKAQGKATADLFAIQTRVVSHMGQLFNDPGYGQVPPMTGFKPQDHRVFKAELAQPPQMWLTHPLNHEREANAKRHYVHAPIDDRSAWDLFVDAQALREQVTACLLGEGGPAPAVASPEESMQALTRQFDREFFRSRYRGIYFGRSIVRCAADPAALCEHVGSAGVVDLDRLYPDSLGADMERLRTAEKELAQLRALHRGDLAPPGGVIVRRGRTLKRAQLGQAISQAERDLAAVQERLQAHDRRCRGVHRALAFSVGGGWDEYLQGLLAALHYADHTEADLRDLQGFLGNTVGIATATLRVSSSGIDRIVRHGNQLHQALAQVHQQANQVLLDATLLQRLEIASWAEALGELKLLPVSKDNVGEWLKVVDGWVDQAAGACSALRSHALEQLLLAEAALAGHLRQGTRPEAAPAASRLPPGYATLLEGAERERQTRLDWWGRFQTADGLVPAGARLLVAGGIVAAVLGLGGSVGQASVTIYNGLARPVLVRLGGAGPLTVPALGSIRQDVEAGGSLVIDTRTAEGQPIERFDADVRGSFGHFVYNVASAAPLIEWTVAYGNGRARPERPLGAPRWISSSAGILFAEPPKSISSKTGGGTREVLSGLGDASPATQMGALADEADQLRLAMAHARWDPLDSAYTLQWLTVVQALPEHREILAARLRDSPDSLLLLRMEQDAASEAGKPAVCQRHRALATAAPKNVDLHYVALRCLPEGPEQDQAYLDGHARHPQHAWFAYAAGYIEAGRSHWPQALAAYQVARKSRPLAERVALDTARIQRLLGQASGPNLTELRKESEQLHKLMTLESGEGIDVPAYRAYAELAQGRLERAVQLAREKPEMHVRVLRFAAASDGAGPALVAQAQALAADQGLDDNTAWAGLALAAKHRRDPLPFQAALLKASPAHARLLLQFVEAVQSGKPQEESEHLLDGLAPHLRGRGYGMGVILLGDKAPRAWRDAAKRLLFASERPYFS